MRMIVCHEHKDSGTGCWSA